MSFRELDVSDLRRASGEVAERLGEPFNIPKRSGEGPLEASTETSLDVSVVIWDVNGYYRALGFGWPFLGITRKDLRLAFLAINGESSAYLTKVFKLLIDDKQRAQYDRAPLGEIHMDPIQMTRILDEVKRTAARTNPSNDTRATQRELLDEMGYDVSEEDLSGGSHYPKGDYPNGEGDGHTEHLSIDHSWRWGYYRWGTSRADISRLGRWQELLVSQLAALEVRTKICVGFIGRGRTDSRFVVARTYGVRTVYLREDLEPDEEMATAAAAALLADLTE